MAIGLSPRSAPCLIFSAIYPLLGSRLSKGGIICRTRWPPSSCNDSVALWTDAEKALNTAEPVRFLTIKFKQEGLLFLIKGNT